MVDRKVIKPTVTQTLHITPEIAQKAVDVLGPMIGAWRTCITCIHFAEDKEQCAKNNRARPPARVIAYGCPDYENDEIPY